ncbi:MAG: hypothetical protein K2W95_34715 [Candidatus Obscuribacterales bacterium]|nr:hypothetical protein [Candidatus Obscuribacterales bacterium]
MDQLIPVEEKQIEPTMEEKLARLGHRIDELIDQVAQTRQEAKNRLEELDKKREATIQRSEEAIKEVAVGLHEAVDDLKAAWDAVRSGTHRAAQKLCDRAELSEEEKALRG